MINDCSALSGHEVALVRKFCGCFRSVPVLHQCILSDTVIIESYSFKLMPTGRVEGGATVLYLHGSLFTI